MKKTFIFLLFSILIIFSLSAYDIGDRVLVNWSGDDYWYPGTIIDESDGKYHIIFDDFDREWVSINQISYDELAAGDQVESRWQGNTSYYSGTIQERRGNAIYILYDDGDEEITTINHVRVLKP